MSSKLFLCSGALVLALAGCSGLSDVDEQPELSPTAVAQVVNYAEADASGNVSANVRAQTEVLLTGKESIEADKPILSFVWKAVNPADDKYITVRNSSTVSVSVPSVGTAREIQYELTVTDSDGDTDKSLATLRVQPVLDSDRFLSYVNGAGRLRLVARTPQPTASTIGFTLELSAHVTYVTRPSTENNKVTNTVDYPIGEPVTGSWLASTAPNSDGGAADFRNPVFEFSLPAINLDDIIRKHQAGLPGTEGLMPDPAFTPDARIEVIAKLTPGTLRTVSLTAVDAFGAPVVSATNNGATSVELRIPDDVLEELRILGGGLENRATADSYYAALDPDDRRLTLKNWLAENCFDQARQDWGADAHAVYVNNYDLGFGRDMYFRSTRPAGCTSATFNAGDAASVVVNYGTLEAAAKKVDPIIAVAMEYKASDPSRTTPGVVSFYVFAPDEGTGEFRRVTTANFDGRGEKHVPGACTVCHGGRPRAPQPVRANTYTPGNTNVDATFMPWDLESFLFSDNDPVFPTDSTNAALKAQYTRAAQEAEFKKLNLAAYSTYGSVNAQQTVSCYESHTGPCDLVKLWYGDDLAATKFIDKVVAKGWRTGFVDADIQGAAPNPASAETLYTDVYARNCRACHTQRVVQLKAGSDPQFQTYAQFVDTNGGSASNHAKVVKLALRDAVMPAARLTMDRLWTRAPGATASAGELLATHLGLAGTQPGRASACATSAPSLGSTVATRQNIARRESAPAPDQLGAKTTVSLDASCSSFVRSYQWVLTPPDSSNATIVGANTSRASFQVDTHGDYDLNLRVTGLGNETSDAPLFGVVANNIPAGDALLPQAVDLNVTTGIDVLAGSERGDEPTVINAVTATGAGLTAIPNPVTRVIDVTATSITGGSVTYSIRDEDNDVSGDVTFNVTVNASISIGNGAGSVAVNSFDQTLNLPAVAAQGQPFRIELWNGAAWVVAGPVTTSLPSRGGGARGSATFNACIGTICSVLYTPPRKTVTPPGATRDTFQYRACFLADTTRCSDAATYTVQITAVTSFASVASILRSTSCNGCHAAGQNALADRWSIDSMDSTDSDVFLAVRCRTGLHTTAFDELDDDDDPDLPPARYVNITTPTASLLRIKPGAGPGAPNHGHDGNVAAAKIGATDLATILSWIQEGGYYTAGGATTCSPL